MLTNEPQILSTQGCPFEGRDAYTTCFLPEGWQWTWLIAWWPLHYLCGREHMRISQSLIMSMSIYRTHLYGRRQRVLYRDFWCSYVLSFIIHTGLSYLSRKFFAKVCCAKICLNYSGWESPNLNQHLLLSCIEQNSLLASGGSLPLLATPPPAPYQSNE